MGVGIELDTENSCRKYQICKPVAPQQRKAKKRKILIFNENRDFFIFPKNAKKCGSLPPLVEQEVEQTGVPNISTLEERFSLIHNILHSIITDSDSYFCQIKV